jgi:putative ABC transport system substrate-binding protein
MIGRRNLVTLLGGAAAASALRPLPSSAQQRALPVLGFLHAGSPEPNALSTLAFRQGLSGAGQVEGRDLTIDYRWADDDMTRLAEMAADLVRRKVAVIATLGGTAPPLAAKAATTTIPIVFGMGGDPVQLGLVASLARPGGNVTGINYMSGELGGKRLALLHEFLPQAVRVALLVNPDAAILRTEIADFEEAASAIGRDAEILLARTHREIDAAFSTLVQKQVDALIVSPDALFVNRRVQITTLAARHAVPAIYAFREYALAGGLMSYGASRTDQARQTGKYAARILAGTKPSELPVMRATRFEFVLNLQTARTLGLEVPATLLARADEVIE